MKIFPIVGIGASAGGLEAFSQLIENLDPKMGMAFVLVQHLDPKHASSLSAILGKKTKMPVREASNEMIVEANHIYVIPPNYNMTLASGKLVLESRGSNRHQSPIDDFFHSLATECKDAAIGVVLSGTGSDGAKGISSIVAEGGITFAQDNQTAKFNSMPAAAISSGAEFIMTPKGIASELLNLTRSRSIASNSENAAQKELIHQLRSRRLCMRTRYFVPWYCSLSTIFATAKLSFT